MKKYEGKCATCAHRGEGGCQGGEAECERYLPEEGTRFISIDGVVEVPPEMDSDTFCDLFIKWIESRGYLFGGGICEYHEEEEE